MESSYGHTKYTVHKLRLFLPIEETRNVGFRRGFFQLVHHPSLHILPTSQRTETAS